MQTKDDFKYLRLAVKVTTATTLYYLINAEEK